MREIRAFVAIELDNELVDTLGRIQQYLINVLAVNVRWVRPEGIHLTVKFLGDLKTDELVRTEEALAGICSQTRPFGISLGAVGGFPTLIRPRVLWVGIGGNTSAIRTFHRRVDARMKALGFAEERRMFRPHLTLGRINQEVKARLFDRDLDSFLGGKLSPSQLVEAVSLMRSELSQGGAEYTRLARFPLAQHGTA